MGERAVISFYLPDASGRLHDLLAEARLRLAQYREAERAAGLTPPEAGDLSSHLRAAISMLAAGIEMGEWGLVAEGLVTVQEAEARARRPAADAGDFATSAPGAARTP